MANSQTRITGRPDVHGYERNHPVNDEVLFHQPRGSRFLRGISIRSQLESITAKAIERSEKKLSPSAVKILAVLKKRKTPISVADIKKELATMNQATIQDALRDFDVFKNVGKRGNTFLWGVA